MRAGFSGCLVAVSIACALLQLESRDVAARAARGPEPAAAPCDALSFGGPIPFWLDSNPGPLATADLNADGVPDIVAGSAAANFVGVAAVRLGRGDGTFGPPARFSVGPYPRSLSVGDFDGDGVPDVAVMSEDLFQPVSYVSLLLNAGDGTFTQAGPWTLSGLGFGAAAADLDGDGRTDLAVSMVLDDGTGKVAVLQGDGAGGFAPPSGFATAGAAVGITSGDFNGDGHVDLAVAERAPDDSGTVEVRLGDGSGGFGPPAGAPVGTRPNLGPAADLDGDGHLDLVSTSGPDRTVSVLLGDGAGGLATTATYALDGIPSGATAADLDGDGRLDLAVAGATAAGVNLPWVYVLPGDGAGSFGAPTPHRLFGRTSNGAEVVAADFDGDGRQDLAATNTSDVYAAVSLLRNMCDRAVDLSVAAAGVPSWIRPGNVARYTLTVTNHGPDEAGGVELDATLPGSFDVASQTPSQGRCSVDHDHVECALGVMAPGAAATVTLFAVGHDHGTWTTDVAGSTGGSDPNLADNTANITTAVVQPGGDALTLASKADGLPYLSWNTGDGQAGYLIVRYAGGVQTILPGPGAPLPPDAADYVDGAAVQGQLNCYVVSPVDGAGTPMARSDMFCLKPGSASPAGAPVELSIYAFGDTAHLSWTGPAGQTASALVSYPLDGSAGASRLVSGATGSAAWTLFGKATCFVVYPRNESGWLGNSDVLCAIPGYGVI